MTQKIATLVSKLNGTQSLYKMTPPLEGFEFQNAPPADYVVASATVVFGAPETYLFPADEKGEITNWGELPGSMKGTLSHEEALREAGYEVASDPKEKA